MGKLVLKDPFISLAANDLSDDFMAVTINPTADTQESTAFGDDWRDYEGGLRQYDLSFDFNQDYDAGALDATVWPLFGTKVAFEVRPRSAARAPANPSWIGMCIINAYPPISGSIGDLITGTLTAQGAGELQRLTA